VASGYGREIVHALQVLAGTAAVVVVGGALVAGLQVLRNLP